MDLSRITTQMGHKLYSFLPVDISPSRNGESKLEAFVRVKEWDIGRRTMVFGAREDPDDYFVTLRSASAIHIFLFILFVIGIIGCRIYENKVLKYIDIVRKKHHSMMTSLSSMLFKIISVSLKIVDYFVIAFTLWLLVSYMTKFFALYQTRDKVLDIQEVFTNIDDLVFPTIIQTPIMGILQEDYLTNAHSFFEEMVPMSGILSLTSPEMGQEILRIYNIVKDEENYGMSYSTNFKETLCVVLFGFDYEECLSAGIDATNLLDALTEMNVEPNVISMEVENLMVNQLSARGVENMRLIAYLFEGMFRNEACSSIAASIHDVIFPTRVQTLPRIYNTLEWDSPLFTWEVDTYRYLPENSSLELADARADAEIMPSIHDVIFPTRVQTLPRIYNTLEWDSPLFTWEVDTYRYLPENSSLELADARADAEIMRTRLLNNGMIDENSNYFPVDVDFEKYLPAQTYDRLESCVNQSGYDHFMNHFSKSFRYIAKDMNAKAEDVMIPIYMLREMFNMYNVTVIYGVIFIINISLMYSLVLRTSTTNSVDLSFSKLKNKYARIAYIFPFAIFCLSLVVTYTIAHAGHVVKGKSSHTELMTQVAVDTHTAIASASVLVRTPSFIAIPFQDQDVAEIQYMSTSYPYYAVDGFELVSRSLAFEYPSSYHQSPNKSSHYHHSMHRNLTIPSTDFEAMAITLLGNTSVFDPSVVFFKFGSLQYQKDLPISLLLQYQKDLPISLLSEYALTPFQMALIANGGALYSTDLSVDSFAIASQSFSNSMFSDQYILSESNKDEILARRFKNFTDFVLHAEMFSTGTTSNVLDGIGKSFTQTVLVFVVMSLVCMLIPSCIAMWFIFKNRRFMILYKGIAGSQRHLKL
ncbi:hypothetical protein ADUPG1_009356 [Aduncisulcus paluster]|uniref:Uncharacterized protein n=1 Tax=Aduncisulcus paluster TaxID=2918883 RepID=A0ABQ5KVC0_9EUKA|nr:hypothetical protein ADUPG1_009356 [Aduncisulcus paluster]